MSERTIWVVDAGYPLRAAPSKFDYLRLKTALEARAGSPFTHSLFFNSVADTPDAGQDGFHNWLRKPPPVGPGMETRLYPLKAKPVRCPSCRKDYTTTCPHCSESISVRYEQRGVDVGIAVTIVQWAFQNRYDRIVLLSGDGDLKDAVTCVREECGKAVVIAGFKGTVSPVLDDGYASTVWLDDMWQEVAGP